jgi:hypothetical protein
MRITRRDGRLFQAVLWERLDEPALEICRLWEGERGFRLEGTVLTLAEGIPSEVRYGVSCDEVWETRAVQVVLERGASTETLQLRREPGGQWWRNGVRVEELDGTTDVDLGFTPATNTLPIRRLGLEAGASAAVSAAWMRFPDLHLEVLPQRYTRLGPDRYRYESGGGTFTAELQVDELGLVVEYGRWWRRVAPLPR